MAEVADLVAPDAKDLGITMPEDLNLGHLELLRLLRLELS